MDNKHLEYLKSCMGFMGHDQALSPVGKWINGTLIFAEEGHVKFLFNVDPTWLNPSGTFHGGMAALLLDEVIGITVYSLGHVNFFTTVNLNLNYLSFALVGDEVMVESKIVRKGVAVMNVEATIYKRNKILVKASSNLVNTGRKTY